MLHQGFSKVVIIGSGPSGVTASLYLKRAGIDHLVITTNESNLNKATIENYYGFESISGKDLYEAGLKQLGNNVLNDEVLDIKAYPERIIETKNEKIKYEYLVLATGSSLDLDNRFKKFLGNGVSICAHCDAPMLRNKRIYYTGDEKYLEKLKEDLSEYSSDLEEIKLDQIVKLIGDEYLEGIELNDKTIEATNLFVASKVSANKLLYTLGMISKNNKVLVNENFESSIEKIYAVGDLSSKVNQISSATYSGMMAALDIIRRIKNE